jgi:hypothetical protein
MRCLKAMAAVTEVGELPKEDLAGKHQLNYLVALVL